MQDPTEGQDEQPAWVSRLLLGAVAVCAIGFWGGVTLMAVRAFV